MKPKHRLFFLTIVFSIICVGSAFSQQANGAKPPFTLEITANVEKGHSERWDFVNTSQSSVKAGSTIVVRIRKTNCSDHELSKSPADGGPQPWLFTVRDSQGTILKSTAPRAPHGWIIGGGPGLLRGTKDMFLQPEEAITDSVPITNGYDMSKPGTYTIQAIQHTSNDPASPLVRSNIIRIRVLPASK